jgi:hypothetical protein
MTPEQFQTRTPEQKRQEAEARKLRTDREVMDDIEARQVRLETKVTNIALHIGLLPDGTRPPRPEFRATSEMPH